MPDDSVTISIPEPHDRGEVADLLRQIADLVEEGNREGFHPRWALVPADNGDSVKLRLAQELAEAVARRAAGAHAATYLTGRINEPGIALDDDGVLMAWDYDPTDPQEHIVVTEADLAADDTPEPDPALVELFNRPSRLSPKGDKPAVVIVTDAEIDTYQTQDVDVFVYPAQESADDLRRDADMLEARGLVEAARTLRRMAAGEP